MARLTNKVSSGGDYAIPLYIEKQTRSFTVSPKQPLDTQIPLNAVECPLRHNPRSFGDHLTGRLPSNRHVQNVEIPSSALHIVQNINYSHKVPEINYTPVSHVEGLIGDASRLINPNIEVGPIMLPKKEHIHIIQVATPDIIPKTNLTDFLSYNAPVTMMSQKPDTGIPRLLPRDNISYQASPMMNLDFEGNSDRTIPFTIQEPINISFHMGSDAKYNTDMYEPRETNRVMATPMQFSYQTNANPGYTMPVDVKEINSVPLITPPTITYQSLPKTEPDHPVQIMTDARFPTNPFEMSYHVMGKTRPDVPVSNFGMETRPQVNPMEMSYAPVFKTKPDVPISNFGITNRPQVNPMEMSYAPIVKTKPDVPISNFGITNRPQVNPMEMSYAPIVKTKPDVPISNFGMATRPQVNPMEMSYAPVFKTKPDVPMTGPANIAHRDKTPIEMSYNTIPTIIPEPILPESVPMTTNPIQFSYSSVPKMGLDPVIRGPQVPNPVIASRDISYAPPHNITNFDQSKLLGQDFTLPSANNLSYFPEPIQNSKLINSQNLSMTKLNQPIIPFYKSLDITRNFSLKREKGDPRLHQNSPINPVNKIQFSYTTPPDIPLHKKDNLQYRPKDLAPSRDIPFSIPAIPQAYNSPSPQIPKYSLSTLAPDKFHIR